MREREIEREREKEREGKGYRSLLRLFLIGLTEWPTGCSRNGTFSLHCKITFCYPSQLHFSCICQPKQSQSGRISPGEGPYIIDEGGITCMVLYRPTQDSFVFRYSFKIGKQMSKFLGTQSRLKKPRTQGCQVSSQVGAHAIYWKYGFIYSMARVHIRKTAEKRAK
jgi:hypothetical protein